MLSLNLKLFRTKVDIKSVIRDYLLKNYIVKVETRPKGDDDIKFSID